MTPIRTLIVDDEPLARKRMRTMLETRDDVVLLDECCDGKEAVSAIGKWKPDLVSLDIQMPELNRFEVVQAISGFQPPFIVFVTAFNEHAVKAFEINALDYLLKPYDHLRLGKTIDRVQDARNAGNVDHHGFEQRMIHILDQLRSRDFAERLAVKAGDRLQLIHVQDIEWIEAAGNHVRLHTTDKTHLLQESMKGIEDRLDPKTFARIHRSAIVNLNCIDAFEPTFHGDYRVRLRNGTSLPLSRNYRAALRQRFGDQI